MQKKYLYSFIGGVILLCCITGYVIIYKNPPLRTAIYRNFAKQTVYLTTEGDTIYSFGYFGVRKWIIDNDGKTTLLAENDSFCHNCFIGHLIGRSGAINKDYLYVAARSYIGGIYRSKSKRYLKGKLLVMRKQDLQIINEYDADYSMIEAKIHGNNLIVSGLQGFNLYNINNPKEPKLTYSFRTNKPLEFQGCEFIEKDTALYVAFARFNEGLSIYNITNPSHTHLAAHIAIQDPQVNGTTLPNGLQTFRLVLDYPYLYSSLGPTINTFGTKNDYRGIMIYDISDINNIKQQSVLIPQSEWYSRKTGDPQPSHIDIYKDKIYVNFCERGVAIFSKPNPTRGSKYENLINVTNGKMILPLKINDKGVLLLGSFNSEKIFNYNLK